MKKTLLVTGGSGFIGRNLVEQLADVYDVIAPSSSELNLLSKKSVDDFFKANKIHTVIHAATHNATHVSDKDLSQVFQSNVRMYFHLVNNNQFFHRMFYFGSGAEFDKNHYQPLMKEEYFGTHIPEDNYGFSKYIMAKHTETVPNVYNLRLFGVYGKYEDWRIRFISNVICMAIFDMDIRINRNMKLDYLYIDDLVRIVRNCIELEEIPYHDINICTAKPLDLLDTAELINSISGKNLPIRVREEGMNPEYSGDNARLTSLLHSVSFTPVEEAVKALYQWYERNKSKINKSELHH